MKKEMNTAAEEAAHQSRVYYDSLATVVREQGGALYKAFFFEGRYALNAGEYELCLRSRLAQYPVQQGCYMIPVNGGDGTGEIANMLERLAKRLAAAEELLRLVAADNLEAVFRSSVESDTRPLRQETGEKVRQFLHTKWY